MSFFNHLATFRIYSFSQKCISNPQLLKSFLLWFQSVWNISKGQFIPSLPLQYQQYFLICIQEYTSGKATNRYVHMWVQNRIVGKRDHFVQISKMELLVLFCALRKKLTNWLLIRVSKYSCQLSFVFDNIEYWIIFSVETILLVQIHDSGNIHHSRIFNTRNKQKHLKINYLAKWTRSKDSREDRWLT